MDIYFKPTDTYLHFGSCHLHNTMIAIPYNLAKRLRVILSDEGNQENV